MSFYTTARVPDDIEFVTTISDGEVPARAVDGDAAELEQVWEQVLCLYRSGIHPAIQICIRRHGEVVMHRSIGYARGNGPNDPPDAHREMVALDTPFNIFSAAKALTATLIHLLDERGVFHVDDLVCEYIPEFTSHGKDLITIKHLLNHRAGIAAPPPGAMNLEILNDPDELLRLLCTVVPSSRPGGRLAYHAVTSGFVLAEVVRRATGKDIRRVMHEEIVKPLGFRWSNYGVRKRDLERVALSYFTGIKVLSPISNFIESLLGIGLEEAVEMSNDPRFLTAIIPSANIVTTADELSLFYQMLLDGGELHGTRLLQERTVRRATAEQSWMEPDLKLLAPIRYSQGFMLGADHFSVFGSDTDKVFGHIGLTNIVGWADPQRQISGAVMTSGKPLLYPSIQNWFTIPGQVATAFGDAPRRPAKPSKRAPARRKRKSGSAKKTHDTRRAS